MSGLYDYGYRDYNPEQGRWTTVDPVKAGANWHVNADPVDWKDWLGLDDFFATYDKNTNKMTVEYYHTRGDENNPHRIVRRTFYATNTVEHFAEPTKLTSSGKHYSPKSFPNGTWRLIRSKTENNATFGPAFIWSSAHQKVPTYSYDPITRTYRPTGKTTIDWGYGIHGGGSSTPNPAVKNNPNDVTLGCIRMSNEDVREFAAVSDLALAGGGSSHLTVTGGKND